MKRVAQRLVVCSIVIMMLTMFAFAPFANFRATPKKSPATAALAASYNSTPIANSILLSNTSYNFTSYVGSTDGDGLRTQSDIMRAYQSTNLQIEREGSIVANYTMPPIGTYNSTDSFDTPGDLAGGFPEGWQIDAPAGGYPMCVDSYNGHSKVVAMQTNGGSDTNIRKYLTSGTITTGSFEFWVAFSGTTATQAQRMLRLDGTVGGAGGSFLLSKQGGSWAYFYSGGAWTNIPNQDAAGIAAGRWYHWRVELTPANMYFYLNGKLCLTLGIVVVVSGAFGSGSWNTGTEIMYLDGWDWSDFSSNGHPSPGYYTNRNAEDISKVGWKNTRDPSQVTLNYNSTSQFAKSTAFGQPVPSFSTYPEPQGTTNPGMWTSIGNNANDIIEVLPTFPLPSTNYMFSPVLHLARRTNFGGPYSNLLVNNPPAGVTNEVEFWLYPDYWSGGSQLQMYFMSSGWAACFGMWLDGSTGNLNYGFGGGGSATMLVLSQDTWYHIRATYRTDIYRCNIYVNGRCYVSASPFTTYGANNIPWCLNLGTYHTGEYWFAEFDEKLNDTSYFPLRNTYAYCNATNKSFSTNGNYNYKWQIWSSGINYDAPCIPFTVTTPVIPAPTDNVELISNHPNATRWDIFNATKNYTFYLGAMERRTMYLLPATYTANIYDSNTLLGTMVIVAPTTSNNTYIFNSTTSYIQNGTNRVPSQDAMLYTANRYAFSCILSTNYDYPSYKIELQYPSGTIVNLNASKTFTGATQSYNISCIGLYFNITGQYGIRYVAYNATNTLSSTWTTFLISYNVRLQSEGTDITQWAFTQTLPGGFWYNVLGFNLSTMTVSLSVDNISTCIVTEPTYDAYVDSLNPAINFGSSTLNLAGNFFAFYRSFIGRYYGNDMWLYTKPASLRVHAREWHSVASGTHYLVYNTSVFDESTITWNNQPAGIALLKDQTWIDSGDYDYSDWFTVYSPAPQYFRLTSADEAVPGSLFFQWSTRHNANGPMWIDTLLEKSGTSPTYAFAQTNITETATFSTEVFSPYLFRLGDSIQLNVNKARRGGGSNTLTGNLVINAKFMGETIRSWEYDGTYWGGGVLNFPVSSNFYADQLEIIAPMRDYSYFDIVGLNLTRANSSLLNTIYVEPYGTVDISLESGSYSMWVFTEGLLRYGATVNVTSGTLNVFQYITPDYTMRVVNIYNTQNEVLDFANFRVRATLIYNLEIQYYWLPTNWFYSDDGTTVRMDIYDRFNNLLDTYLDIPDVFIDITLSSIFSFKVQNRMRNPTLFNVTRNGYSYSQYLLSDELHEYILYNGTYNLNYTQSELNTVISVTYDLIQPSLYIINSSYYSIFISAYSSDTGYTPPLDSLLFYINGTQYFLGETTELLAGNYSFIVRDCLSHTLYSGIQSISNASSIYLPLSIYSLKIQNLMRNDTYYRLSCAGGMIDKWLLANTQDELFLGADTYTMMYIQTELNLLVTNSFAMSSSSKYIINTSYYTTYFSAFSNDLLGVPADSVRLYIDGQRKPWGPVELLGIGQNLTVLDYFNDTIYTTNLTAVYSEYNVFINMASLSLYNNQSSDYLTFNITKSNVTLLSQSVAPQQFILFRFINGTYNISSYFQNGTLYRTQIVTILPNSSQLVSFGNLTPDYSAVYASDLYIYALFKDQISWSTNVDDNLALFYKVHIINYENITGIVYFEYNGILLRVSVAAMETYPSQLYVPRGATYALYDATNNLFLSDFTAVSANATGDSVKLDFGFWHEKYSPNVVDETSLMMYMIVTGTAFAIVIAIAIALSYKYSNAKNSKRRSVVT